MPMLNVALRQSGRTTKICEQARKNNNVVVCANRSQARFINTEYNIDTVSIDFIDSIVGTGKNIIFDHYTLELYPYLCEGLTIRETIKLLAEHEPKDLRCQCGHKIAEYTDTEVCIMDRKCKTVTMLQVVDGKLTKVTDNIPDCLIAKTPEQVRFNLMVYGNAFIDEKLLK